MYDKRFSVGLITTVANTIKKANAVAKIFDIKLQISDSANEEAITDALEMEANGIEAIIAGQGTGSVIRDHIHIPMVTLTRASYDIIKGLKRASKINGKTLFPIHHKTEKQIDLLAKALNTQVDQRVYTNIKSIRSLLLQAKSDGYKVIISGGLPIKYGRELGFKTVEIDRSYKEIQSVFETAISIIKANREERENSHRYRCIIEAASNGIIASDKSGRITAVNQTARKILAEEEKDIIGEPISRFLTKTSIDRVLLEGRTIDNSMDKIKQKSVVSSHMPIIVDNEITGCVSDLNEVSSVIRTENTIRKTYSKGNVAKYQLKDLIHQSEAMKAVIQKGAQFAKANSNLLITGKTGTGKEIMAQGIHRLSARKRQPFVSLNCAALPDQLLESELFGYEEGAFTGSKKGGRPGLFEIAHKGTIFLDEIGETTENVQLRLLRVLQEREIMRLGGDRLVPIDVRVIAASNRDLGREVHQGRFREDLFFRLNVLKITIPPLKERLEDIPMLLQTFIQDLSKQYDIEPLTIPKPQLSILMEYGWPGNVRQLKNFAEQLVLLCQDRFNLSVFGELEEELIQFQSHQAPSGNEAGTLKLQDRINEVKSQHNLDILKYALEEANYSKSSAAKILGVSRTTLWKRMKEAGL